MTLKELKDSVSHWSQSEEATFIANLNAIVQQAEKRIYNRVMVPDAKNSTTLSIVQGTKQYTSTMDMVMPLRLWITTPAGAEHGELIRKSASYIREAFVGAQEAEPTHYAWLKSSPTASVLLFGPTPNDDYTVNIEFMDGTPPSLVSAETWLSTNFPEVLRKVTIHEAAIYLKMWESEKTYKQDAEEAISSLAAIVGAPQKDEFWP